MFIYKELHGKNSPEVFGTYDELLKKITPDLTWNHYYREIKICSEDELKNMTTTVAPKGWEDYKLDQRTLDLYNLNRISSFSREAIPEGWSKIKWVVGIHYERHIKSGDAFAESVAAGHGGVWYEPTWGVVGVIANNWPEKEVK